MKQATWKDLLDSIEEIEKAELNAKIQKWAATLSVEDRVRIVSILEKEGA
jgi:hypothetical protein